MAYFGLKTALTCTFSPEKPPSRPPRSATPPTHRCPPRYHALSQVTFWRIIHMGSGWFKHSQEAWQGSAPIDDFVQLVRELTLLEQKYGLDSAEFYKRYQRGEMGDEMEIMRWASKFEIYEDLPDRSVARATATVTVMPRSAPLGKPSPGNVTPPDAPPGTPDTAAHTP